MRYSISNSVENWSNRPVLLDAHGGLYVLSEDGTTRDGSHSFADDEKVIAVGDSAIGKWVCTDKALEVCVTNTGESLKKQLGRVPNSWSLPYPNVCSVNNLGETLIAINAVDCVYCVRITNSSVNDWIIESNDLIYSMWQVEDGYVLAGMSKRVFAVDETIESWGNPVTITVTGESWLRKEFSGPELNDVLLDCLIEAEKAGGNSSIARRFAKEFFPPLKIEAVIQSIVFGKRNLVVCAVKFDSVQEEHWPVTEEACMSDYNMFALVRINAGHFALEKFLHNSTFACCLEGDEKSLIYFLRTDRRTSNGCLTIVAVNSDGELEFTKSAEIGGLTNVDKIFSLNLMHDLGVGYYGSVGVFTENGSAYFLMKSDDAISWWVVHRLRTYGQQHA